MKRWMVMAVAVPLAAAGARKLSQTIERRRGGSSKLSRLLRTGADTMRPNRARRGGGLLRTR